MSLLHRVLLIFVLVSYSRVARSMDAAAEDSSSSESGETDSGEEAIPAIDPPVAPNVVTVEKPEFFDPAGASKNNRPVPLPVRPQNPYPDFSGKIADSFPSDPPFQGEPRQTDSSNNVPFISSSIKSPQEKYLVPGVWWER